MVQPWFERMDESGETPITRVQKSGYRALAELMLSQEPEEPEDISPSDSDLHHAAYWGLSETVKKLLDEGVDPRDPDDKGDTSLHQAARNGHLEVVTALLDHGANANQRNPQGMTPLHWVAMNGRNDLAQVLLDHGADPNARDTYTNKLTPMAIALLMGYDELAECLAGAGGEC